MATTNFVNGTTTVVADWLNDVDAHAYNQTAGAHSAAKISFTPTGSIAATNTQAAIAEVATDAATALSSGIASITATTVPLTPVGNIGATNVQVALSEVDSMFAAYANKVVNGNFMVNQDSVTGTVVLAAGVYGHDQWKGGSAGCTYTFATTGANTVITITAGSLVQPIEGLKLASGTHVLAWNGTAQGKIGAGSFGTSPQSATQVTGTDVNIEFNTGTLSLVRFNQGHVMSFDIPDPSLEFMRCSRYYYVGTVYYTGQATAAGRAGVSMKYPTRMRVRPTIANWVNIVNSGFPATTPTVFGDTVDGFTADRAATSTTADGRWSASFTSNARLP